MPGAEYVGPIPSSNFANNGGGKIGAVVHVTVITAAEALIKFKSPGVQVSSHFIVSGPGDQWPDGHILQVLDTAFDAYAQAAGNYPPTAYIAIELAGTVDQPMSAAQMISGADIIRWAAADCQFPIIGPVEHGIPGVTPHCHPNGQPDPAWGNHPCPGTIRLAQIPAMIAAAQGSSPEPIPIQQKGSVFMIPSNSTDNGAVMAQIREWWATYRSDKMATANVNILLFFYHLPTNQTAWNLAGWGGNPDLLLASIIDTAGTNLRPQYVGAV